MEANELFDLIRERCDMDEVLDVAGIGMEELLLRFRGQILAHRDKFEDYLGLYEGGFTNEG